ncbi:MAG: flavodoxin domain-containing protein [Actinomycetaceae bacterium]|nr:flavodoxin domain-containing protein [Actinomycetaceae bacterium]
MKVLVTVASKHGSSREVGAIIADELRAGGLEVDEIAPAEVHSLEGYGAVVIGSAVYMTQWMDEAREFASRFSAQLEEIPLWAFSVGMSGVATGGVKDPSRVGPVLLTLNPRGYTTFKGKIDPSDLSWRERTVAKLGGAVEGDFREEDAERAWAKHVVAEIRRL